MPGMMKKKPGAKKFATKSKLPPVALPKKSGGKKMNPLDKAIMEGRRLPSKNKKPGRYLDR